MTLNSAGEHNQTSTTIAASQSPHRSLLAQPSPLSPLASTAPKSKAAAGTSRPVEDDSSDEDDDLAPLSHAQLMDKLANSLRSALRAKSGAGASASQAEHDEEEEPLRKARKGTGLQHEPEEEEEDAELDVDAGLEHLKWNPDVQVVNPRTASRSAQKQQQDLLAAGKEAGLNKHVSARPGGGLNLLNV